MNTHKDIKKAIPVFCFAAVLLLSAGGITVEASVEQIKIYKKAFPNAKPTCLFCHIDKLPKKDDGMHGLNAYGLKVQETDDMPSEGTYKKIGSVEDFEVIGEETVTENEPAGEE